MTRATRIALLAACLCAPLPLSAPAGAHALLVASDPPDGAHLQSGPRHLRLTFSEEISPRFQSVRLVASGGARVAGVHARGLGRTLSVDVPRLAKGTYDVSWEVLAEDDGHRTSGAIVFGVRVPGPAHGNIASESKPSLGEIALRWLRFSLIALLLGCIAVASAVLAAAAEGPTAAAARRRALTAAAIGGGLAAAAGVASAVHEVLTLSGSGGPRLSIAWQLFGSSRWGHLWVIEQAALLGLTLIAVRSRRGLSAPAVGAAALGAAAIVICEALVSHAASVSGTAVTAEALHILAAALWLGGVAGLAVAIWPVGAVGPEGARQLATACRRRFAVLAGAGAAALALTGLYSAAREVASIDALLTTFYGGALIAKVMLVAVVIALGAVNSALLRRLARGARRSVAAPLLAAELVAGAGVFLAAGVLAAGSPARGPQFAAPRPPRIPTLAANVDDLLTSATVRPNRPGENIVTVQAVSSRRPPPAPVDSIEVRLADGSRAVELRQLEPGRYVGTVLLARVGRAGMSVVVHRAERFVRSRFSWSIDPPDPARPVVASNRRLTSIVDPLALALLFALATGATGWVLHRRGRLLLRTIPRYREEPS